MGASQINPIYGIEGEGAAGRPASIQKMPAPHDSGRARGRRGLRKEQSDGRRASVLSGIEPAVHVPAGLKHRERFLGDRDLGAIARVSSGARLAPLDPEHTKAAQLNPISLR